MLVDGGDVEPGGQPVVGDLAVPLLERDAQLPPGQVGAEAAVGAGAEGDVVVRGAVEVDVVAAGEVLLVTAGRRQREVDDLAGLERAAVELDVAGMDDPFAAALR